MTVFGWNAVGDYLATSEAEVARNLFDYFASDTQTHLGRYFEPLSALAAPDRFDAYDLAALWSLSVTIKRKGRHQLLHDNAEELTTLLRECQRVIRDDSAQQSLLTCDIDRLTASESPFVRLWNALLEISGVGETKASKLMAAKFPELIPVWDSQVSRVLGGMVDGRIWRPMHELVTADDSAVAKELAKPPTAGLTDAQQEALAEALEGVSILRRLDAVLWMKAQPKS